MTFKNSDNEMTSSEKDETQHKTIGRPRNPKKWNPDGTLNTEYSTLYFREHYHKPHTCEYCGKIRKCSDNVVRHQRSARCVKARQLLGLTLPFPTE